MPGVQEIAMIVGGILLLAAIAWVVNKVNANKGNASQKQ